MPEKRLNELNELICHLNGKTSKGPWRMEQDEKTSEFIIYDSDFRSVAKGIYNENDAIFIVNLVNLTMGK